VPGTAPILGERAKKIPTDKSRDFVNGGNLQYELVAAKFGKFSKCLGNASLESPGFLVVGHLAFGRHYKQK